MIWKTLDTGDTPVFQGVLLKSYDFEKDKYVIRRGARYRFYCWVLVPILGLSIQLLIIKSVWLPQDWFQLYMSVWQWMVLSLGLHGHVPRLLGQGDITLAEWFNAHGCWPVAWGSKSAPAFCALPHKKMKFLQCLCLPCGKKLWCISINFFEYQNVFTHSAKRPYQCNRSKVSSISCTDRLFCVCSFFSLCQYFNMTNLTLSLKSLFTSALKFHRSPSKNQGGKVSTMRLTKQVTLPWVLS